MTNAPKPGLPDPSDAIPYASTVVLLRDGLEVFLMKRHGKSGFMGGVHVFPGGKVDDSDRDSFWRESIPDNGLLNVLGRAPGIAADAARAVIVASVRETLEEAGVILGSPVPPAIEEIQRKLNAGELGFADWVRSGGLCIHASELVFFDHWITPEIEKKRFNTFFFAARVPEGQTATSASRETTEGVWMHPAEAVAKYRRGEITLAPPTCTTLIRLSRFDTPEAALEALRRRPVCTNLPRLMSEGGKMMLALPGHPSYGDYAGILDPEGPSCIRMTEGKWFPEMAG